MGLAKSVYNDMQSFADLSISRERPSSASHTTIDSLLTQSNTMSSRGFRASRLWTESMPPPPTTKLGRHRQLAPNAGIHVSPLCIGAMSIGEKWGPLGMGEMTKEQSFKLLDAFYAAGGNFIDTANSYQDGESEQFIGEWMKARDVRDHMVVATKYTSNWKRGENIPQKTSYVGNNMKSLYLSVEKSLKDLRTSYIDILYVHWWDWTCGVEEVMNGLHHLVAERKVLYLGVSDTPSWFVSKANMYARLTGKTPFVVYQGAWSVLQRDLEREIIPMARAEGMAIAPWNVLAAGKIRTDAEEERRRQTGEHGRKLASDAWERTPEQREVCVVLEKIANEVGAKSITAVAIAYVIQKTPYVFPIVGGRKVEHLMDNISALDVVLSDEQIDEIDSVHLFELGFPHDIIGDGSWYSAIYQSAGYFDKWPRQQPIRPAENA
ncbi:arylalcohol dehydrogenase [Daedalea quercina L-15889]|uniref:Arylalcohol dehydrogenase n=1 Tax=Daedalea quercina L-15889 TaxID=1314783 RepID=A0A165KQZ3_9APHY|nr:arylalcohol dehydrogenase [Daedalea quercina L-15889]